MCCLKKLQSWVGTAQVDIQMDHSAIVKWYKEDLCTISRPLGRRGQWHEFLGRFNLIITYREGKENRVADALSRFAYPAGYAQNTKFHGGDDDLERGVTSGTRRMAIGTRVYENGRAGILRRTAGYGKYVSHSQTGCFVISKVFFPSRS